MSLSSNEVPAVQGAVARAIRYVSRLRCPEWEELDEWPALRGEAVAKMQRAASSGEWLRFVLGAPVHVRLRIVEMLRAEHVPLDIVRPMLAQAWRSEKPAEDVISRTRLIRLFRSVGYISEGAKPRPGKPLLLFRGALPSGAAGMSWTPDANTACMFAWLHQEEAINNQVALTLFALLFSAAAPKAEDERAAVYGAFIEPSRMLAHFDGGRGLDDDGRVVEVVEEYVVDPEGLPFWEVEGASDPVRFGELEYAARVQAGELLARG